MRNGQRMFVQMRTRHLYSKNSLTMPIQVNEIVIRAIIDNEASDEKEQPAIENMDKDLIVTECVEQVLEILKEREER